MRLARGGDLMQGAAQKAAAEHRIYCRDAERQAALATLETGGPLQGLKTLSQLGQHRKSLKENQFSLSEKGVCHLCSLFVLM